MTSANGAGSNPQAGGSSANTPATNPQAGGSPNLTPAQQSGAPAAGTGSNPQAGGSGDPQANNSPNDDTNGPISRDVYNERVRAEAALRKRVLDLEAKVKAQDDAKLTEHERDKQRADTLEAEKVTWLERLKTLSLQRVVDAQVREKNLADPAIVLAILKAEYADVIEFDDNGNPVNAEYQIGQAIAKYPSLVNQSPPSQVPGSGRQVSPPRTPAGQYAQRPQQPQEPKPFNQFPNWSQLTDADWDTESRRQRGQ